MDTDRDQTIEVRLNAVEAPRPVAVHGPAPRGSHHAAHTVPSHVGSPPSAEPPRTEPAPAEQPKAVAPPKAEAKKYFLLGD